MARDFKDSYNQFLRIIWDRDYLQSEERLQNLNAFSDDEVGSPIRPIAAHTRGSATSSTPRRITRSQGKVREYPNVQPRTLEYK